MPNELSELLKKLAEKEPEKYRIDNEYDFFLMRREDGEYFPMDEIDYPSIDFCIDLAEKLRRRIFVVPCSDEGGEMIHVEIYPLDPYTGFLDDILRDIELPPDTKQREAFQFGLAEIIRDYLKEGR